MKLEDAMKWVEEHETTCDINICPISKQPIQNNITLKCGHSFEYYNLFNELVKNGNTTKFHKCPYCRSRYNGFIPYYDISNMNKYYNIKKKLSNFNNEYLQCEYVFKSGNKKGLKCNKCAHQFNHGNFCFSHKDMKEKKNKPKTYEIKPQCCHILKNGNRCKKACSKNNDTYCYLHVKNN